MAVPISATKLKCEVSKTFAILISKGFMTVLISLAIIRCIQDISCCYVATITTIAVKCVIREINSNFNFLRTDDI